jgi:hypothetical protein
VVYKFNHRDTETPRKERYFISSRCLGVSVVILFFLSACASISPELTETLQQTMVAPSPSQTAEVSVTYRITPSPSQTLEASSTPALSLTPSSTPTPSVSPTPTADTRLLPAQWKQWPVIPAITGRGLDIYRAGLALGNDPHAFSKVADCQGIREVLLGAYDLPGYYKLSPEHAGLQETIDWFGGSFNRNGMAVMGGFNARAVLQPQFADPAFCLPGETPIACEYRVHRPSIVLISLEFGYDGRTTANYIQYMRTIIDFYISKGVLPILATKADNYEGDQSLNLATATLAYEYDLPLWNWWLAAQPLYNHGLDPTRPDGFHLSVDAWRVRSATALEAIDAVWQGMRVVGVNARSPSWPPAFPPPTPTSTPSAPPALDPKISAMYSSGHALLSLAQRKGEGYEYLGIYAFDPDSKATNPLQQILGAGWNLQSVAPNGKSILVNRGTELWYVPLDGTEPKLIEKVFDPTLGIGATWLDKDHIVAVQEGDDGRTLITFAPDNPAGWKMFGQPNLSPIQIFPAVAWGRILTFQGVPDKFYNNGELVIEPYLTHPQARVWETVIDSGESHKLDGVIKPVMNVTNDSSAAALAYSFLNERDRSVLALTTLERSKIWSPLPDGYALDYAWSNSGRWLAALLLERSDYSGKAGALRGFLLNPLTLDKVELPAMAGLSARLAWSADGRYLLVAATEPLNLRNTDFDKGYRLNLYLVNAGAGTSSQLDGKISPSGQEYLFATNIAWIP